MTTDIPTIKRRIRMPIAATVVLIGVVANFLVDMIADGEFSQSMGYRMWKPYGIFVVYYPMLMDIIRWLVPLLGVGAVVMACRKKLRTEYFVWCLCVFGVIATVCIAIGIFMTYGLYSVMYHKLGG